MNADNLPGNAYIHIGRFAPAPWTVDAACKDKPQELFYPTRGEEVGLAKEICAGCPVRQPCLDYALDNGERFGVWGGTSERERRRIRRRRHVA